MEKYRWQKIVDTTFKFQKKSMETETKAWLEFQNRRKANADTRVERNTQIQKIWAVRITARGSSRKANHLVKVVWEKNIITEFSRSLVSPEKINQSLWRTLKFQKKKKKKLADGLIDRNSSMLHEITSRTVHKEQHDYW